MLTTSHARSGFSLMEIMIAIAIIALMGAVGVPIYLNYQRTAASSSAKQNLTNFKNAIQMYKVHTGHYPKSLSDLTKQKGEVKDDALRNKYEGPYLETISEDPWGNSYKYKVPGKDGKPYDLYSLGEKAEEATQSEWILPG